ncbi:Bacterial extracellular solute-binding protein [Paenibacillus konkukensis]|uniref:Bacterial extracellular solute-binding protein n=1 Tax=Paenibacillus konkukensis TaxID=2020716 RepID=A0ABY4RH72_9BACL|nr:extracellular solute-binding protein [Paenibacillus konkukensis]UQZ81781.1 Bacterial extracellular solute-binding protein [Paenibacillus konkukensis]
MSIVLRGITWNHTRGFVPMAATSQRFAELNPGVDIRWEKRSLQEFADAPIEKLVEQYDLLVIDHPWAGYAARSKVLLPLNEYMNGDYLQDQAAHSVGVSHKSYEFDGSQTALAIDAAAPVASWREDVLKREGEAVPKDWDSLLRLARKNMVAFPAIAIDSLMNFYALCLAHGEEPFRSDEIVVSAEIGQAALDSLRELAACCRSDIFGMNPIAVYEAMSRTDEIGYCPFAYGYSNYAREGYSSKTLSFGDVVSFGAVGPLRTTLGGTGLAVSAFCSHKEEAVRYAQFAASPEVQRTLYTMSGGQPGHRGAWTDEETNRICGRYFAGTLPALDRAYMRPRYNGYLHFQDHAGDDVREYMMRGGNAGRILERLNELYRESLIISKEKQA